MMKKCDMNILCSDYNIANWIFSIFGTFQKCILGFIFFLIFLKLKKCKLLLLAKEQTVEKCAISNFATLALFSCCHSEGSDGAICFAHKPSLLVYPIPSKQLARWTFHPYFRQPRAPRSKGLCNFCSPKMGNSSVQIQLISWGGKVSFQLRTSVGCTSIQQTFQIRSDQPQGHE